MKRWQLVAVAALVVVALSGGMFWTSVLTVREVRGVATELAATIEKQLTGATSSTVAVEVSRVGHLSEDVWYEDSNGLCRKRTVSLTQESGQTDEDFLEAFEQLLEATESMIKKSGGTLKTAP